jgi:hypothetical protein
MKHSNSFNSFSKLRDSTVPGRALLCYELSIHCHPLGYRYRYLWSLAKKDEQFLVEEGILNLEVGPKYISVLNLRYPVRPRAIHGNLARKRAGDWRLTTDWLTDLRLISSCCLVRYLVLRVMELCILFFVSTEHIATFSTIILANIQTTTSSDRGSQKPPR